VEGSECHAQPVLHQHFTFPVTTDLSRAIGVTFVQKKLIASANAGDSISNQSNCDLQRLANKSPAPNIIEVAIFTLRTYKHRQQPGQTHP
jgi:hypothetical protein